MATRRRDPTSHRTIRAGRIALRLVPVLALAACAQHASRFGGVTTYRHASRYAPSRYYPPPGDASDPWGPYIREAAGQYGVPEQWIRAVMRQESGGREQAISSAGAMGLMQVMPATYDELRQRYNLGADPYDPHNNIRAGTAYIREMYDRFGAPGFLAAYNAGPDRLDLYLAGNSNLPNETVNYLAAITPNLGNAIPFSGPLSVYAANSGFDNRNLMVAANPRPAPTVASFAAGCDVNAAYDPDQPCRPLEREAIQPTLAVMPGTVRSATCDPDAAYDPDRPCTPLPRSSTAEQSPPPPSTPYAPAPRPPGQTPPLTAPPSPFAPVQPAQVARTAQLGPGNWAIQVGAFATPGLARAVAEGARSEAGSPLRTAVLAFPPTTPFGGTVLYRARLTNLTASSASTACQILNQRQLPCIVVPPATS